MSIIYNIGKFVGKSFASMSKSNAVRRAFRSALRDSVKIGGLFLIGFTFMLGFRPDIITYAIGIGMAGFAFWFSVNLLKNLSNSI